MSTVIIHLGWLFVITILAVWVVHYCRKRRVTRVAYITIPVFWVLCIAWIVFQAHGSSPFWNALGSGDHEMLDKLLIKNPELANKQDWRGDIPLHVAVEKEDSVAVDLLLKHGARVNALSPGRVTPLHTAARVGALRIAEMLIASGANLNAVGFRHNDTPLLVAVQNGNRGVVDLLLARGADASCANMFGQTALDVASEKGFGDIRMMIMEATQEREELGSASNLKDGKQ